MVVIKGVPCVEKLGAGEFRVTSSRQNWPKPLNFFRDHETKSEFTSIDPVRRDSPDRAGHCELLKTVCEHKFVQFLFQPGTVEC
ncbi:MAG: hypothetical protein DWI02_03370 [Planctomycetota bacterium]|nr:MAG: hypothetical protein DWI02_03370 [Planctomycetota bacterium]